MVLGRAGMRLEGQKFVLYLMVPITASIAFNEPSVQKASADYFQFMKYPSNPKTNLKDEFDALKKQREEEIEWEKRMIEKRVKGREEYKNQLKQLKQLNAERSVDVDGANGSETSQRKSWFGWVRGWKWGSNGNEKDISDVS
mmetsp:Transcript_15134/g.23756  ORF Transcript_15134/g.23756 Transcript_15134/m.23756 type:complete len:142 (-) Transcript_15134:84-509(-)